MIQHHLPEKKIKEGIEQQLHNLIQAGVVDLSQLSTERRKKLIERLREKDRPLLATEKAHGPG